MENKARAGSMSVPAISCKPTKINGSSFSGEDYLAFKIFSRRSFINTLLMIYETDQLQFGIQLECFIQLEQTCRDKQYHLDNDVFAALYNRFCLHKMGKSMLLSSSNCTERYNTRASLAPTSIQSLAEKASCDIKLILQNLLDNTGNEEIFCELFGQLLNKQQTHKPSTDYGQHDNTEAMDKHLTKTRGLTDKCFGIRRLKNGVHGMTSLPQE